MGTPRKKKRYPTTTVERHREDALNTLVAARKNQEVRGLQERDEVMHSSTLAPVKLVQDIITSSSSGQVSQTPRNLRSVRTQEREKRNLLMAIVFITVAACVHYWNLMLAFSLLSFGGFFLNAYFRAPKEEIQNRVVDLVEDGALETNAQAQTVESVLRHSHLKNPGQNIKKMPPLKGLKSSD